MEGQELLEGALEEDGVIKRYIRTKLAGKIKLKEDLKKSSFFA